MPVFDVHKAGYQLSSLLVKVEAGEDVVITRNGEPVARLVQDRKRLGARRFGAMKWRVVVSERLHRAVARGGVGVLGVVAWLSHNPTFN